jgi:hypothetical protein
MSKRFDAPQYLQLNKGGALARMCILKNAAAYTTAPDVRLPPSRQIADWRAAREYGFNNWAEAYSVLSQGFNDSDCGPAGPKKAIWYCHTGEQFRDERNADEISGAGVNHHGWYSDADCSRTIYGIVGRLTHGRFIAGYANSDTSERVYLAEVYTDEKQAARAADHEAQRTAEDEKEYDESYQAASQLRDDMEQKLVRVRELIVMRNLCGFEYVRDELRNELQAVRDMRAKLKNDYSDIQF